MQQEQDLPIIRACYEFLVWLVPKIGKFPRDLRFTLGDRIERQLFIVLEYLIRAQYQRDRSHLLNQANVELEILRFQIRAAHELKVLSTKTYGNACSRMTEIGQQIGGWRKASLSGDRAP